MKAELLIDQNITEPKIVIITPSVTEEVYQILKKLSEESPDLLTGIHNEKVEILEKEDLIRIYADHGKVFAITDKKQYVLKMRLYELEQILPSNRFVRISNSEIIHLKKVKHFDLSITGTICVKCSNGDKTYVSRRYVPKLKKILGI